jgi:hypothetical protein
MGKSGRILSFQLRFRPAADAALWRRVNETILRWDDRLALRHVKQASGPDPDVDDAWSAARAEQLAALTAGPDRFMWIIFSGEGEDHGINVLGKSIEVAYSIKIPWPKDPPKDRFVALLDVLSGVRLPALAMVYDHETKDQALVMEGLKGLTRIPPLAYLDADAAQRAGGSAKLHAAPAPAEVTDIAGGVLVASRKELKGETTAAERKQLAAIARHLGITEVHPLVLAA